MMLQSNRPKLSSLLTLATFALGFGLSLPALASPYWTPWTTDGSSPVYCTYANEAARGFDCDGSYCDNARLYCDSLPYGITVGGYGFSDWFSEEDDGLGLSTSEGWYRYDDSTQHVCKYAGAAGIVTGIACRNFFCDDISIECATPYTHFEGVTEPVEYKDCSWSSWYSEENPALTLGYGRVITGVKCGGSYCNDKKFYVCTVQAAADSCSGSCGGEARGGCFCDEACTTYGDCCSDYEAACVPF